MFQEWLFISTVTSMPLTRWWLTHWPECIKQCPNFSGLTCERDVMENQTKICHGESEDVPSGGGGVWAWWEVQTRELRETCQVEQPEIYCHDCCYSSQGEAANPKWATRTRDEPSSNGANVGVDVSAPGGELQEQEQKFLNIFEGQEMKSHHTRCL